MWPTSFVPPEVFRPGPELFQPIPPDRIRLEILLKLRWSILGSLEDICIQTGINEDGTEGRQPFLSHPLALESLAVPPVSRLRLDAVEIYEAKHFRMLSEDYEYEQLVIENADGSPVTIKNFVTQAHHHLSQHKDMLIHYRKNVGFNRPPPPGETVGPDFARGYYDPEKHDLFFKYASSNTYLENCLVSILTAMEGERGKSAEDFWKSQRTIATSIASHRANVQGLQSSTLPSCAGNGLLSNLPTNFNTLVKRRNEVSAREQNAGMHVENDSPHISNHAERMVHIRSSFVLHIH